MKSEKKSHKLSIASLGAQGAAGALGCDLVARAAGWRPACRALTAALPSLAGGWETKYIRADSSLLTRGWRITLMTNFFTGEY